MFTVNIIVRSVPCPQPLGARDGFGEAGAPYRHLTLDRRRQGKGKGKVPSHWQQGRLWLPWESAYCGAGGEQGSTLHEACRPKPSGRK